MKQHLPSCALGRTLLRALARAGALAGVCAALLALPAAAPAAAPAPCPDDAEWLCVPAGSDVATDAELIRVLAGAGDVSIAAQTPRSRIELAEGLTGALRFSGRESTIFATSGSDEVIVEGCQNEVIAKAGDDRVVMRCRAERDSYGGLIRGGRGDDRLVFRGAAWVQIEGGAGAAPASPCAGGDEIDGGPEGPDSIRAGAGDDWITAHSPEGNRIHAGPGADHVETWSGRAGGGPGDDLLRGRLGAVVLRGGPGDDRLSGSGQADLLRGGPGDDLLLGWGGPDRLYGGPGADVLRGGAGADLLRGRGGADALFGGGGRDRLHAGPGRDRLDGGAALNRCWPGRGATRLRNCLLG